MSKWAHKRSKKKMGGEAKKEGGLKIPQEILPVIKTKTLKTKTETSAMKVLRESWRTQKTRKGGIAALLKLRVFP